MNKQEELKELDEEEEYDREFWRLLDEPMPEGLEKKYVERRQQLEAQSGSN